MKVLTIRARVRPDRDQEVRDAAGDLFAAVEEARPENLRYGSCQLADGSYLILLQVAEGTENPLPQLPAFHRFQALLQEAAVEPSTPMPGDVVGSYRLF